VRRRSPKPPYDLKVVPAQEPVAVERFLDGLVDALLAADKAERSPTLIEKEESP